MVSATNTLDSKEMRINLRTSSQEKAIIERAATIRGVKVSQFILKDAVKRAKAILEEEGVMLLDDDDRKTFVNGFLETHQTNPYLANAIKAYTNG
jgi:uncharacterized protein (DUF1778 family)